MEYYRLFEGNTGGRHLVRIATHILHTGARARTHAHTRTRIQICTRTHMYTHYHTCEKKPLTHTHALMHTRTHTHTHTQMQCILNTGENTHKIVHVAVSVVCIPAHHVHTYQYHETNMRSPGNELALHEKQLHARLVWLVCVKSTSHARLAVSSVQTNRTFAPQWTYGCVHAHKNMFWSERQPQGSNGGEHDTSNTRMTTFIIAPGRQNLFLDRKAMPMSSHMHCTHTIRRSGVLRPIPAVGNVRANSQCCTQKKKQHCIAAWHGVVFVF